jgi:hypothetical protein
MAVGGYHELGGTALWPAQDGYRAGTVRRWATSVDGERWWSTFDTALARRPPAVVWVQLCVHDDEVASLDYDTRLLMLRLRTRWAGPVLVSAVNAYDPPDLNGYRIAVTEAQAVVSRLVAAGRAAAGPSMSALTAVTTRGDHIHPNVSGRDVLGQELLEYFG